MVRSRRQTAHVRRDGIQIVTVDAADPVLLLVDELCYHTLHRPFGVTRQADWNVADHASTHLVALAGDELAGYARLIADGTVAHVRQVAVVREYRGRAVASDLVTCALVHARAQGLALAFLNARTRAVGTYERIGFRAVGEPFRMGRTYLPHVRMERALR